MRVISRKKLKDFWKARKHDSALAELRLLEWHKVANNKNLEWKNFAELKLTFGSVDQVGNCVIFDVGNNLYRLIGRINYRLGRIYVLKVMDHAEYDKNRWPGECHCHKPPPKRR
jgi:mRNA interferase HigB